MNFNKLKSIFLTLSLAISIFFTGCSSNNQSSLVSQTIQTEISSLTSNENELSIQSNNSYQEFLYYDQEPTDFTKATVVRVVDGDTMKLKLDETKEEVSFRLLLVDTPESVKSGVDAQPYSIEASNFTKDILKSGDTVYIEYDSGNKTDKYNRHLGYLWFYNNENSNWQMFNEKLVSQGYARVGYIYSQKRHLNQLYKAEDYAKTNKLNIWSIDGYVTDNGYDVDAYKLNNNNSSNDNTSDKNTSNEDTLKNNTVYVNISSKKYHSSPNAHNMKNAVEMSEDEAKEKGYQPCSLCY